ncbi:hypothetical protein Q3G72_016017 [Acer saccharum]|nr:hypothetical protein Q3G72_016017 [Acer saccharum]
MRIKWSSQAEVPVKLQFWLFSGPSLIPSPVPAIQIGSIQMPLLHPHVGPSLAHQHPSQPPIYQFGQLRYTSPISQRVLPLGTQSVPFVQPNKPAQFSTNQNVGVSQPIQPKQETSAHNMMKSDALSRSESFTKSQNIPHFEEGNHKRTIRSGEDVDAPLQSGIVRVFEQPGIEDPSDEDDFIEVRSKRQMLNDRREQREKEIKAKSWVTKVLMQTVFQFGSQSFGVSGEAANSIHSDLVGTEGRNLANTEFGN